MSYLSSQNSSICKGNMEAFHISKYVFSRMAHTPLLVGLKNYYSVGWAPTISAPILLMYFLIWFFQCGRSRL